MGELLGVASAFGLSAPAGLNAYLPLLIVGLTARFTTLLTLSKPFDLISNEWVLGVLAILVMIELLVDKVPGVDHVNDAINTFIRPVAGAILFASSNNAISDLNPALGFVAGLLTAGGVHVVKSATRPIVTTLTAGMGNPVISLAEDVITVLTVVAAIVAPILVLFFAILVMTFVILLLRRRSRPALVT